VPPEVLYRRKMGFGVPLTHWFRNQMKDFLRDVSLSEKSFKRGLIKPEAVTQMVNEHISGQRDHNMQIWTLLMLELWFQRFID
jgi:asparagine synthase (glutamine-hydrolysing)